MKNLKYLAKLMILFLILFVVYLVLIQVWDKTSVDYKPKNALDHVTRIGPTEISDWSKSRRLHD